MNRLPATLRLDVRLQARSRLYAIGIGVAILLGLVGRFFVPPDYAGRMLAVFYLTGLGGTTYFFGGSLVLMEKSEGTLQALRVTPLTSTAYIASKVVTLTSFALLESGIVYVIGFLGVPLNPLPMILGVVCLGVIYTLVGLGQAAEHDSVTGFLLPGAAIVTGLLQLPVVYVFYANWPVAWIIPSHGSLLLMLGASEPLPIWHWIYALAVTAISILLAFWWARARFAKFINLQEN